MSAEIQAESAQNNTDAQSAENPADVFYSDGKPGEETKPVETPKEETQAQAEKPEAEKEGEEKAAIEYEAFTLPEGIEEDAEVMDAFKEYAREAGLDQAKAQSAVDLGMKLAQKTAENVMQSQIQAWAEQRENWVCEIKADAEFGGGKFQETVIRANRALERFADADTIRYLQESGFGDNPGLIRLLARADKAMGEDKAIDGSGGNGNGEGLHPKDVWYNN